MRGGGKIRRPEPDCEQLGPPQQQANPISEQGEE
jgi:hypothetical protein